MALPDLRTNFGLQNGDILFETFDGSSDLSQRSISASKPVKIFNSLEDLDLYVQENYKDLIHSEAGISGFISYEGDVSIALYEELRSLESGSQQDYADHQGCDLNSLEFELKKPDDKEFLDAVVKCQKYIEEGDIYQANITRKFLLKLTENRNDFSQLAIEAYKRLVTLNPAPYAGFMNLGDHVILSSSPESFLKIHRGLDQKFKISTSPIKGTADLNQGREFLESSEKDKAEHIMIVDLERNDLGRICEVGSVTVDEMFGVYKFKNLYHYISTISGFLRQDLYQDGLKFGEIFKACFPGGSITGTPKIRAMEIIEELEPCPRGPYTGAMGYYKFKDFSGEFNILIRSIIFDKQKQEISIHSGGGITSGSDPVKELIEANLKAEKLLEVFL